MRSHANPHWPANQCATALSCIPEPSDPAWHGSCAWRTHTATCASSYSLHRLLPGMRPNLSTHLSSPATVTCFILTTCTTAKGMYIIRQAIARLATVSPCSLPTGPACVTAIFQQPILFNHAPKLPRPHLRQAPWWGALTRLQRATALTRHAAAPTTKQDAQIHATPRPPSPPPLLRARSSRLLPLPILLAP